MNLNAVFEPRSVAVVGASTEVGSVGNDIVKNLIEQKFSGNVYPVNPKTDTLYGVRCYPNLSAIEGDIDLAVVAVPAKIVPSVIREAVEKKIKGAVVISSGFREMGNGALEDEIVGIAREGDMVLIGPNCLGIVNPYLSMNASFARTLPKKGGVAFLSQSGALGTAVLDMASGFGIGFSKFVSLGNKAMFDESALLDYFAHDRKTKVIAIYAEDLRNSDSIKQSARAMMKGKNPKPIIVLKSGRTAVGSRASSSHTGSLAGRDASYEALFEESGILRAETAEELFLLSRVFTRAPIPKGKNIAILTNAGGPGVLAADSASEYKLPLAELSPGTIAELRLFLPPAAGVNNPVDILGDAKSDRYERALDLLLRDESVHMVLTILTPQSMTDVEEVARVIAHATETSEKPIVAVFMGGKLIAGGTKIFLREKIPIASFPEDGVCMLSALANFSESKQKKEKPLSYEYETFSVPDSIDRKRAREIFQVSKNSGHTILSPFETLELFSAYGFPIPKYGKATNPDEAVRVASEIGTTLAMKILSDDITHKSDAGGVLLGLAPEEAGEKFQVLLDRVRQSEPEASLDGALLMEMAPRGGIELIVGSFLDPSVGQTIMLGSGGIYVEILQDAVFGLAPISRNRAEEILAKLRIFPLLNGARGGVCYDMKPIVECLGRLSQLLIDFPDILELDINPLIVYPKSSERKGVLVVDGRVLLTV